MTKSEDIIQAFDDCLDYVFGQALGRDNPHSSDAATAKKWIDDGLTLVIAVIVFHEQMSWMHEKFIRFGNAKDRKYLPSALKVFNENIEAAIRRQKSGGQVDDWDRSTSLWRSRIKGWQRKPALWNCELWGPAPFEDNCRAPASIVKEISARTA